MRRWQKVSDPHEIKRSDWPNNVQEPHPVSAAKRGPSFLPNLIFVGGNNASLTRFCTSRSPEILARL